MKREEKISFRTRPEPHNTQFIEAMATYQFIAGLVKNKKTLDAGCGFGYGTDYLAEFADEAVGVDYDAEAIDWAKKYYRKKNLNFLVGDLKQLNFPEQYFDVICFFEVIHQSKEPQQLVGQLRKILKTGGVFLASTRQSKEAKLLISASHLYSFTAHSLQELLLGAGFKDIQMYGLARPQEAYSLEKKLQRLRKVDFLGLKEIIPRKFLELFSRLFLPKINYDSFKISKENIEASPGILAICRKAI